MEKKTSKLHQERNGSGNGIKRTVDTSLFLWAENITHIDLSHKNIEYIDEKTNFPPNLYNLDLSHNRLSEVPSAVANLDKLKLLNLSYNNIQYFDDTPKFCHTIEIVNLSCNHLGGPPYWVWVELPRNLKELNLYYNVNLTQSFQNGYFEELLQHVTLVERINIANCRLKEHIRLLSTFSKAKVLEVGVPTLCSFTNHLEEIPCIGLDKCCDIERLNLCNTHIYNVNSNIGIYKFMIEINLSQNYIGDLPKEFCDLENLEICILSCNHLLYLPDDIYKLKKLVRLHVDSNELCTLPERICELDNLQFIDLYNNCLYEVPDRIRNVKELDLAQNYFDEPTDVEYLEKREKFRLNITERFDGRKIEMIRPESDHSCNTTDDEDLLYSMSSNNSKVTPSHHSNPPSSPEDWDSDEYWVPCYGRHVTPPPHSPWLYFVKRKMAEGNFCPMDSHTVPIAELVKYQKLNSPKEWQEVEGQFDDYSDDNS